MYVRHSHRNRKMIQRRRWKNMQHNSIQNFPWHIRKFSFPLTNSYDDSDERLGERSKKQKKKNYAHGKTNATLTKEYTCNIYKDLAHVTQFVLNLLHWMVNDISKRHHIQLEEESQIVLRNVAIYEFVFECKVIMICCFTTWTLDSNTCIFLWARA